MEQKFLIKTLTILLLAAAPLYSYTQDQPQQLLGSFVFKNKAYNYEFNKESADRFNFIISAPTDHSKTAANDSDESPARKSTDSAGATADSTSGDAAEVKSEETADDSAKAGEKELPFTFSDFSQKTFTAVFITQMQDKYGQTDTTLKDAATEVYFKILARLGFIDDEPVTAYMVLKYTKIYSYLLSNTSVYYKKWMSKLIVPLNVDKVTIETMNGAIKNISATLFDTAIAKTQTISAKSIEFKNLNPITISGKFDPEKFAEINLYCFNCYGIKGLTRYIKLGDLVSLKIVYENDKEDYSPSNRLFSLSPTNNIVEMKKEKRSQILQIAAFTDLVGLDQQEPNGLLQIEASRKININTTSKLLFGLKNHNGLLGNIDLNKQQPVLSETKGEKPNPKKSVYLIYDRPMKKGSQPVETIEIDNSKFHSAYQTWFNYIEPRLLFSKIEQNNRVIDSSKAPGNKISPLTLYQYQIASFGFNLQVLRLNFPQAKLQWNVLTAGAFWARSRIATTPDSTGPNEVLNSLNYEFKTSVDFQPDSRWGASLGFCYLKQNLWNSAYSLSSSNPLLQYQFDGFLKTNDYDKLFFRFRWTYEANNHNSNYTQIQLGYSMFLFGSTAGKTNKQPG